MKLSEYIQKKKELEQATIQMKRAELAYEEEKKKRSQVHLHVDQHKFKPWMKTDAILLGVILILFGVLQFQIVSLDSDGTSSGSESIVTAEAVNDVEVDTETDIKANTETDVETTENPNEIEFEPVIEEIKFDVIPQYQEKSFTNIDEISGGKITYSLLIKNLEDVDLKCDGDEYRDNVKSPNNFAVAVSSSDGERSVSVRIVADPGAMQVVHKVNCYKIGTDASEGTTKDKGVKLIFL